MRLVWMFVLALVLQPVSVANARGLVLASPAYSSRDLAELNRIATSRGYSFGVLPKDAANLASAFVKELQSQAVDINSVAGAARTQKLSEAFSRSRPDLAAYTHIHVVSPTPIPIELVQVDEGYIGDQLVTSHTIESNADTARQQLADALVPRKLQFRTYVVALAMPMPSGHDRAEQDVVQEAISQEAHMPVELLLNPRAGSTLSLFGRPDVSLLHLDTHGGPGGESIQVDTGGTTFSTDELSRLKVTVPLTLIFGCEGSASPRAFASTMVRRGGIAAFAPFAPFYSFGLTGNASTERQIYSAFLDSLKAGNGVGEAARDLRRAAHRAASEAGRPPPATRFLFMVVGNAGLSFEFDRN